MSFTILKRYDTIRYDLRKESQDCSFSDDHQMTDSMRMQHWRQIKVASLRLDKR